MRYILALALLVACQPVQIDPTLAVEREPERVVAEPEREPDQPAPEPEPPTPIEPTITTEFYIPERVKREDGTASMSGCGMPVWQNSIQLYRFVCEFIDPSFTAFWIRKMMGDLGMVEGTHYEVNPGYTNRVNVNLLDATYMGSVRNYDPYLTP